MFVIMYMGFSVSNYNSISFNASGSYFHAAFEEYSIHTQLEPLSKIENNYNLPWSVFVGAAGMPGMVIRPVKRTSCDSFA